MTSKESSVLKRSESDEARKEKSEETYNREVTEKKTTIVDEPKITGNKETFKKTIITEKEETIQKTEVLKFTQIGGTSNLNSDVDPLKLFEERKNQRRNERDIGFSTSKNISKSPTRVKSTSSSVTKSVKFGDGETQKLSDFNSCNESNNCSQDTEDNEIRKMGSPTRFASCRDRSNSPSKRTTSEVSTASSLSTPSRLGSFGGSSDYTSSPSKWSPVKEDIDYVFNTTIADNDKTDDSSKFATSKTLNYSEDDWNEASAGNRKKRLKNLASKFHEYDEDENERINARLLANAAVSPSPDVLGRRNTSKVIDIDQALHKSSERKSRSPTKKSNRNEAGFIQSLKAQGFEESESKSKLTYDFKDSPSYRSTSPTKIESSERPPSPYKHNPHQFICPQKGSPSVTSGEKSWKHAASRSQSPQKTPAYRSVSPTRMLDPKPSSPFKPHPLQFISPQKSNSPAKNVMTTTASETSNADGPPKPQRIFAASGTASTSANLGNESELNISNENVNYPDKEDEAPSYAPPSPPKLDCIKDLDSKTQTDTASRRSILEKKTMFENVSSASSPSKDSPDPAMLPLSQRKALFEKNRSIPKPIARFGESVTPAMLSKASEGKTPIASYSRPIPASEPAWKRKRDISPKRIAQTPTTVKSKSPTTSYVEPTDSSQTAGIHQRFEKSRRLFENVTNDWRESDIAKTSNEAKKNDMEVLMNRFKKQRENESTEVVKDNSNTRPEMEGHKSPEYPGINSMKKIKVSPPKPGQLYPDLNDIYTSDSASDMDRPGTAMSDDSCAPSEAPSLGCAIKHFASSHKLSHMPSISESKATDVSEKFEEASSSGDNSMTEDDQINDMLDEALDVSPQSSPSRNTVAKSHSRSRVFYEGYDDEATPPKSSRIDNINGSPLSSSSTKSWEYQTASSTNEQFDFKTPRIEPVRNSPMRDNLPSVETEDGVATPASDLMHTVSFYRKQRGTNVNITPHAKITRNVIPSINEEEEEDDESEQEKDDLEDRIKKLQTEVEEQMQRRMQASKALEICASKNEFEGSFERVEFERLLLEAHHKYAASTTEMNRLKTEGARRMSASSRNEVLKKSSTKGAISISGISIPMKADFIRLMSSMPDQDTVHYFLCLVKYRSQVIATQMLSTLDGISARKNKLVFTNLINVNELDFDFQIYLEVYGLQTPRERLSHEAKYHIRKEKSLFNLTPLKKLKKQDLRHPGSGRENPVNSLNIRKSKFGLVGYTTITIDTLKSRNYRLQKVPTRSPLDDGLEMKLNVYSESRVSRNILNILYL